MEFHKLCIFHFSYPFKHHVNFSIGIQDECFKNHIQIIQVLSKVDFSVFGFIFRLYSDPAFKNTYPAVTKIVSLISEGSILFAE